MCQPMWLVKLIFNSYSLFFFLSFLLPLLWWIKITNNSELLLRSRYCYYSCNKKLSRCWDSATCELLRAKIIPLKGKLHILSWHLPISTCRDHNPPTFQTDGRHARSICAIALYSVSRYKKNSAEAERGVWILRQPILVANDDSSNERSDDVKMLKTKDDDGWWMETSDEAAAAAAGASLGELVGTSWWHPAHHVTASSRHVPTHRRRCTIL